jgi:raffinose/stachyose/melibiose transport system permease protein
MRSRRVSASTREIVRKTTIAGVALLLVGVPLWLTVVTSMKPYADAVNLNLSFPRRWAVTGNYGTVLHDGHVWRGLENTLFVVCFAIVLTLFLGSLAAWNFGRGKTRSVRFAYYCAIAGLLLPPAVVTSVLWYQRLHLYGSRFGLVAFYVGAFLPLAIFLMTGFVKTIPVELEEAALMDGCSSIAIYWYIVLPLLRPALASTFIVMLILIWNDLFAAFFLLPHSNQQTLALGLFSFVSGLLYRTNWNLIMADVVVVSLPLLLIYIAAQRWLISGLTRGSVNR